jgi:DNA-binding transcriptional MerR regulator
MPDHSLSDLVALTGLSPRTIRYYITEGLVPSPGREGAGTRYPDSTLARLRVIGSLKDAHLSLAEIRSHLHELSGDELTELATRPRQSAVRESALDYVRGILEAGPTRSTSRAATGSGVAGRPAPSAAPALAQIAPPAATNASEPTSSIYPTAERSEWERIGLGDGIELHVRRPLSRQGNRMVERLVAFAGQLQGQDPL